jgi:ribosome-associated protein
VSNEARVSDDQHMRDVAIREGTIRLGQFLKLADLIEAGGDAKALLAAELVDVNGELETRRGRQLVSGDVVSIGATSVRVA